MMHKKHIDWKRVGWTALFLAILISGTFIWYYSYTEHLTHFVQTGWQTIQNGELRMLEPVFETLPQSMTMKIFFAVLLAVGSALAGVVAIYSIGLFGWGIWQIIKRLIHFYYHNGEDKR